MSPAYRAPLTWSQRNERTHWCVRGSWALLLFGASRGSFQSVAERRSAVTPSPPSAPGRQTACWLLDCVVAVLPAAPPWLWATVLAPSANKEDTGTRWGGARCWPRGKWPPWMGAAPPACCGTGRDASPPGTSGVRCSGCEMRMLARRGPGGSGGGAEDGGGAVGGRGKARRRTATRGPSGELPEGQQEGEATVRSASAVCPSSFCSGTKPGDKNMVQYVLAWNKISSLKRGRMCVKLC